jgi:hypothetical protein
VDGRHLPGDLNVAVDEARVAEAVAEYSQE